LNIEFQFHIAKILQKAELKKFFGEFKQVYLYLSSLLCNFAKIFKTSCIMKVSANKYFGPMLVCILLIAGILYYFFFSSMTGKDKTQYLYIDQNDNIDSVLVKLKDISSEHGLFAFQTLARHTNYKEKIRTGRYGIKPSEGAFTAFRHIKNGMQEPLNLTIPSVRTMDRLAAFLSQKLMLDSTEIITALNDSAICRKYGYTKETMPCMFIPNTYDIYWNVSTETLLDRMKKESDKFWNKERTDKANALKLSPQQVITMASIVDEETANDQEKPMIAGMYYNRLNTGMPLQADPTVKFAIGDFSLKRIYNNMLFVNSPYNTYRNTGLPPGPIRIPTVAGIDAVLNLVHHEYLYMCAKEDFSGTHNFARTYAEHLANAAKYSAALNKRGIK